MQNYDVDSTCRICLKTITIFQNSFEIFSNIEAVSPNFMIFALSNVSTSKDDGFPQKLCISCHKRLVDGYTLHTEIIESDKQLRGTIEPFVSIKEEEGEFSPDEEFKDLQSEIKKEDDEKPSTPQKKVSRVAEKKKRLRSVKIEKPDVIQCCMCEYPAETDAQLRLHVTDKHPNVEEQQGKLVTAKTIKCEYCLKYFKSRSGYRGHFRRPYSTKEFVCVHCGSTFRSKSELKSHEEMHDEGVANIPCTICNRVFKNDRNLKRHMKNHGSNFRKFQCDYCSRLFTEKGRLESHIRSHLDIRDFPCQLCPKKFVYRQLLTIHMRTHTGERPHACWCGKAYKHNTDLKRHQYEHSGTRPFKCSFCDRTFFQRSNMKVHERVHTGELPFQCSICSQRFKHHAHWKLHLKKHSEETLASRFF